MKQYLPSPKLGQLLLKIGVVAILLAVLYFQLLDNKSFDLEKLYAAFQSRWSWQNAHWLLWALLLMPFNWLLETFKWRVLMREVEQMSLWRSWKAVLAGATFSIFTPNRIGEYGGRVLLVQSENRLKAVIATLVGSFAQMTVLLLLGGAGFLTFLALQAQMLDLSNWLWWAILGIYLAASALLLFIYFRTRTALYLLRKQKGLKRWLRQFQILRHYKAKVLWSSLRYGLFRYIVYSFQYYVLLQFFGFELSLIEAFSGIAFIFLLQTGIPLPPATGLVARGSVALYVWGFYASNDWSILAATFTLWIINMVIASLIGAVFILRANWGQSPSEPRLKQAGRLF